MNQFEDFSTINNSGNLDAALDTMITVARQMAAATQNNNSTTMLADFNTYTHDIQAALYRKAMSDLERATVSISQAWQAMSTAFVGDDGDRSTFSPEATAQQRLGAAYLSLEAAVKHGALALGECSQLLVPKVKKTDTTVAQKLRRRISKAISATEAMNPPPHQGHDPTEIPVPPLQWRKVILVVGDDDDEEEQQNIMAPQRTLVEETQPTNGNANVGIGVHNTESEPVSENATNETSTSNDDSTTHPTPDPLEEAFAEYMDIDNTNNNVPTSSSEELPMMDDYHLSPSDSHAMDVEETTSSITQQQSSESMSEIGTASTNS